MSNSIFYQMLLILFILLKVTNSIDWSWWWVFAPLWLPFCVGVFLVVLTAVIVTVLEKKW